MLYLHWTRMWLDNFFKCYFCFVSVFSFLSFNQGARSLVCLRVFFSSKSEAVWHHCSSFAKVPRSLGDYAAACFVHNKMWKGVLLRVTWSQSMDPMPQKNMVLCVWGRMAPAQSWNSHSAPRQCCITVQDLGGMAAGSVWWGEPSTGRSLLSKKSHTLHVASQPRPL